MHGAVALVERENQERQSRFVARLDDHQVTVSIQVHEAVAIGVTDPKSRTLKLGKSVRQPAFAQMSILRCQINNSALVGAVCEGIRYDDCRL